jgi:phosphoenolpyruvate synthase/pyruvate phosphate dikinase
VEQVRKMLGANLREFRDLRRRIRELEDEVQECRAVNLRVAELTDIVVELMVPLARGDQEELDRVLERYHESL